MPLKNQKKSESALKRLIISYINKNLLKKLKTILDENPALDLNFEYERSVTNLNSYPLHNAVSNGKYEIAQLLINKGARVDFQVMDRKMQPIHICSNEDIVGLLIKNGANINASDSFDCTPLHYACMANIGIIEVLMLMGANVNVLDASGKTPKDLFINLIYKIGHDSGCMVEANQNIWDYYEKLMAAEKLTPDLQYKFLVLQNLERNFALTGADIDEKSESPGGSSLVLKKIKADYHKEKADMDKRTKSVYLKTHYDKSPDGRDRELLIAIYEILDFTTKYYKPLLGYLDMSDIELSQESEALKTAVPKEDKMPRTNRCEAEGWALSNIFNLTEIISKLIKRLSPEIRGRYAELLPKSSEPWINLENFGGLVSYLSSSHWTSEFDDSVKFVFRPKNEDEQNAAQKIYNSFSSLTPFIEVAIVDIVAEDFPKLKEFFKYIIAKELKPDIPDISRIAIDNIAVFTKFLMFCNSIKDLLILTSEMSEQIVFKDNISGELSMYVDENDVPINNLQQVKKSLGVTVAEDDFMRSIDAIELSDLKARFAVLRRLQQIGELMTEANLPGELKNLIKEVDLKAFRGVRDAISHLWQDSHSRIIDNLLQDQGFMAGILRDLGLLNQKLMTLLAEFNKYSFFNDDAEDRWRKVKADFGQFVAVNPLVAELCVKPNWCTWELLADDSDINKFIALLTSKNPKQPDISELKKDLEDKLRGRKPFFFKNVLRQHFPSKKTDLENYNFCDSLIKNAEAKYDADYKRYEDDFKGSKKKVEKFPYISELAKLLESKGAPLSKLEKVELSLSYISNLRKLLQDKFGVKFPDSWEDFFVQNKDKLSQFNNALVKDCDFKGAIEHNCYNLLEMVLNMQREESGDGFKVTKDNLLEHRKWLVHGDAMKDAMRSGPFKSISQRSVKLIPSILKYIYDIEPKLIAIQNAIPKKAQAILVKKTDLELHQEDAITAITNSNGLYDNLTLDFVLSANIAAIERQKDVFLSPTISYDFNIDNIDDYLKSNFVDGAFREAYLPIHINGNHFVGLYLKKNDVGQVSQALYINPTGQDIPEKVMNLLNRFRVDQANILSSNTVLQHYEKRDDETILISNLHCGPFTIFIGFALARGDLKINNYGKIEVEAEGAWQEVPNLDINQSDIFGRLIRNQHANLLGVASDDATYFILGAGDKTNNPISFLRQQILGGAAIGDGLKLNLEELLLQKVLAESLDKSAVMQKDGLRPSSSTSPKYASKTSGAVTDKARD